MLRSLRVANWLWLSSDPYSCHLKGRHYAFQGGRRDSFGSTEDALGIRQCRYSPAGTQDAGHLDTDSTQAEYEQIIHSVISEQTATVYLYSYNADAYVAVVADVENQIWLAMFALDGVLESVFVVERPEMYLSNTAFVSMGTVDEVLT